MLKLLPLLLVFAVAPVQRCGSKRQPPPRPQPTPVTTPTPEPTIEPTPEPTAIPSATPTPQPAPTAEPSATPTPEPSPSPVPTIDPKLRPTPYPTPVINLTRYLHEQGGRVVTVNTSNTEDAGAVINAADNFDGPGKLVISGGGKIKTQVVLKHDSEWIGEYSCEVETWEGCILLHDNTKLEGGTFYEPTFVFSSVPSITVIQTFASAKNNYASSQNVTVKGVKIVGRQTVTDGGVKQAISFGNCKNCAAIENDLSDIASIGIQFGGGAAQGNHAENVLAYRNKLRRFAAAAIALVNVNGAVVAENDIRDPGRKKGEPGGISGVDIESNNIDDCVKDIKIFNNYIGYGKASQQSIGNGILGQNVFGSLCSGGLLIANNVIDGWEGQNGAEASLFWGLSSGLYLVGQWPGGIVVSNTVIRAVQQGIACRACHGLTFQDVYVISSGGGGLTAVALLNGSSDNTIGVKIFDDPSITPGSTMSWIACDPSSGVNVFKTDAALSGCKQ